MTARDWSLRAAALAASLLLHLLLLLQWSDHPLVAAKADEQPPNSLFVQIDFPQPEPQAVMPVEEPPPQAAAPEPPPRPKPKPKPKPKPQAKPAPTPVVEPQKQEAIAQSAPAPPPTARRRHVDLRNAYLSKLLAKIEQNKFYPTIARRRNLQGMIQVRFRLGCGGEVEGLKIDGQHSLLRKAAGKAIEASLPLPEIPAEIECPMLIDYAMAYTLEQ